MPHLFPGWLIQPCDICSEVVSFINTAVPITQIYRCNKNEKLALKFEFFKN